MDSAILDTASDRYLGEWKRLVSTTNWDKGRIIYAWRAALADAGAVAADYCDDAWSRQVGNVTPQHVGRLRRVYERFGDVRDQYTGLYWSHFQAVLDWNDAEMWLEGAVQNGWSISEMRFTRADALGQAAESSDADAQPADWDDDAEPDHNDGAIDVVTGKTGEVRPAHKSSAEPEDDWSASRDATDEAEDDDAAANGPSPAAEPVRPFANLASLPADVSEAFESFKLSILKHKLAGWAEIARTDLLGVLDALKELALSAQ